MACRHDPLLVGQDVDELEHLVVAGLAELPDETVLDLRVSQYACHGLIAPGPGSIRRHLPAPPLIDLAGVTYDDRFPVEHTLFHDARILHAGRTPAARLLQEGIHVGISSRTMHGAGQGHDHLVGELVDAADLLRRCVAFIVRERIRLSQEEVGDPLLDPALLSRDLGVDDCLRQLTRES